MKPWRVFPELTYQFFKTMLKFCFPYNNTDDDDVASGKTELSHHIYLSVIYIYILRIMPKNELQ